MRNTLLALALAAASLTVLAHPSPRVHYHVGGTVTYSNTFRPVTVTTYETDRRGRQVRVETTTTCTDTRLNRRNNHLRCLDESVTVQRFRDGPRGEPRPVIAPVVTRVIERDEYGRRVIVTTTRTCTNARWNRYREAVCFDWDWDTDVTREYVRRDPGDYGFDLNGDGRTDAWERLLFSRFRELLDDE